MATVLILDSEALSSVARARSGSKVDRKAQAVIEAAQKAGADIRVPAAVLAEVIHGTAGDAAVNLVMQKLVVVPLSAAIARIAGALLHGCAMDSRHAVDAFVVATAIRLGGGIIATHDVDDITRLAAKHPNIKVFPI